MKPRHRWPARPLIEMAGGVRPLMRQLGAAGHSPGALSLEGSISDKKADRYATALGLHPSMVWPEWDRAALTVGDDMFVNEGGWRPAWLWSEAQKEGVMT